MELFDLHTHILPGVDDGAQTMEQALQMLRNAAAGDVTHLVVTPHYNHPGFPHWDIGELRERFQLLQEAAQEIPVTLFWGCEVHVCSPFIRKDLPTLNGSRYLLTELPPELPFSESTDLLQSLLQAGYTPIVAHPERYNCICQSPARATRWLELGCHLQLTSGSIMGKFGEGPMQAARSLLQRDLVACIASDAHGALSRTNYLATAYNHLFVHFGPQYARILMYENPLRICQNQPLGLPTEV